MRVTTGLGQRPLGGERRDRAVAAGRIVGTRWRAAAVRYEDWWLTGSGPAITPCVPESIAAIMTNISFPMPNTHQCEYTPGAAQRRNETDCR